MIEFLFKRLYILYLAMTLGFSLSFGDWEFWAILLPVIFFVENLHK
jgi:hypothetical protein